MIKSKTFIYGFVEQTWYKYPPPSCRGKTRAAVGITKRESSISAVNFGIFNGTVKEKNVGCEIVYLSDNQAA